MSFNRNNTLEELENDFWGDPEYKSHLVTECHKLRKVPLADLNIENLRILIGQKVGLKFLVPLALEYLEKDPLSEGDMYKGDLLACVAAIGNDFWELYPDLNNRLVNVKNDLSILSDTITKELLPALKNISYK